MDHPLKFQISITDTQVLLCFDKANFPTEVASIEQSYQQLTDAQQTGDPQRIQNASMQLHQRILALLRAPSHEQTLQRGH
jgi:DNA-binding GntR family transcriptional regulator